jgi:hypothetical protein
MRITLRLQGETECGELTRASEKDLHSVNYRVNKVGHTPFRFFWHSKYLLGPTSSLIFLFSSPFPNIPFHHRPDTGFALSKPLSYNIYPHSSSRVHASPLYRRGILLCTHGFLRIYHSQGHFSDHVMLLPTTTTKGAYPTNKLIIRITNKTTSFRVGTSSINTSTTKTTSRIYLTIQ